MTAVRSRDGIKVQTLGSRERPISLSFRGPLRLNPVKPTELEIFLGFTLLIGDAEDLEFDWLPLSDYGYFPLGTEFHGDHTVFPSEPSILIASLTREEDFMVPDGTALALDHPISSDRQRSLDTASHRRTLDRSHTPTLVVANGEIARFYLSAISVLAYDLLSLDINRDAAFAKLCQPKKTRLMGDGTLHVAPKLGYLSRPAAMQIALTHACPDIIDYWSNTITQLRALHADGEPLTFHRWLPEGTGKIEATTRTRVIRKNGIGAEETVVELREIVQDLRAIELKSLVIELPSGTDRSVLEDLNEGLEDPEFDKVEPRTRNLLDRLLGRTASLPGSKSVQIAIAGRRFSHAFPALEHIDVEYVKRRRLFGLGRPKGDVRDQRIFKLGTGPKGRGGSSAWSRATFPSESPRRKVDYDQLMAPPVASGPLAWEPIDTWSLPASQRAMIAAGDVLVGRGFIPSGIEYSRPIDGQRAFCAKADPAWGNWSASMRPGDTRRIFALPLVIEERFFWALEIEASEKRRSHGMGLLMPLGAFEPSDFLANYLANIARRQRASAPGIVAAPFPKGSYPDAWVASLHHRKRRLIAARLADAIAVRCERAVAEQRLLTSAP